MSGLFPHKGAGKGGRITKGVFFFQLGLLSGWHICGDGSGRIQSKGSFGDSYRYGISPDRIAAFGDDEGDLEMLQVCGVGVAMGNALPYVKAGAAYVTKSNEEDGVAWFIDRYILGKRGEKGWSK